MNDKKYLIYLEHFGCAERDYVGIDTAVFDSIINNDNFCGFMTHIEDSREKLEQWFDHPVFQFNVGVDNVSDKFLYDKMEKLPVKEDITLMFWGSWCDPYNSNFGGRGGHKVDEICCRLMGEFDNVRLIVKSGRPLACERFGRTERYANYVSHKELCGLHMKSDIFMLPAEQVHASTVPFAMSFGLPVLGNNKWGMSDYLTHGVDSLVYEDDQNYVEKSVAGIRELILERDKLRDMSVESLKTQRRKFSSDKHDLELYSILRKFV